MKKLTYTGESVEITYEVERCIHAAECANGLPAVFDPNRKPWVDADGAPPDEVAEVIRRCPTGALKYRRLDGGPEEVASAAPAVTVSEDGPLYVEGNLRIHVPGADEPMGEARAALCRCGASAAKPFCDNAHEDAGFRDRCTIDLARAVDDDYTEETDVIEVTPLADGPLKLEGLIEISGVEGDDHGRFAGAFLCRCGASRAKPFCDGSHRAIEFEAEGR